MAHKPASHQPQKAVDAVPPDPAAERARRRAATLRENLRHRKQQQRLRRDEKAPNSGDSAAES
jgi:hypothetical protein